MVEDTVVDSQMELPIAGELRSLAESQLDIALERYQFANQAGITFKGSRDFYEVFGYKRNLTPRDLRERYERGGIAGAIVDAYPDATWQGVVDVWEDEDPNTITPFEAAWRDLFEKHDLSSVFCEADKLAGQGQYSVLFLGFPAEKLSDPVTLKLKQPLLYVTPFAQTEVTIQSLDQDVKSPRFGQPLFYQLRRTGLITADLTESVHWTRVVHIAENTLGNPLLGRPRLERVWNNLDDLDKVTGGGAEAYFQRANRGMHVNIDKDLALPGGANDPLMEHLRTQVDAFKHGMTRFLQTRGVDVKDLGSEVADFNSPADAIITQISGALRIPKRILTGSEMGQLASGQDRDNWNTQVTNRQTRFAQTRILKPVVQRLIDAGTLPKPAQQFKVEWPEKANLTFGEKLDAAKKMADTNRAQGTVVFGTDEIRSSSLGWGPMDDEQLEREKEIKEALRMELLDGAGNPVFPQQEAEIVDKLEAALQRGGSVDLVVRGR